VIIQIILIQLYSHGNSS